MNGTVEEMGADLAEGFDELTDWREHFQAHPWAVLATAGVCGYALARMVSPDWDQEQSPASPLDEYAAPRPQQLRSTRLPQRQLAPLADNIAEALVAVATSRVKEFIAAIVPGFEEHLARVERRGPAR